MKNMKFNPEISLGHILQFVAIGLAVTSAYYNLKSVDDNHDLRIENVEQYLDEHRGDALLIIKTSETLVRLDATLNRIGDDLEKLEDTLTATDRRLIKLETQNGD